MPPVQLVEGNAEPPMPRMPLRERLAEAWDWHVVWRSERPWLALIAVPLAMVATALLDLWWVWIPLLLCAWWWSPREWPWTWLLAPEAGVLGALWAYIGASLLATSAARVTVGAAWAGCMALLAAVTAWMHRRAQ